MTPASPNLRDATATGTSTTFQGISVCVPAHGFADVG
jgi:hypothetical protein